MTDTPGRDERRLARALITALPDGAIRLLQVDGIDLAAAAEHVLYVALRQARLPESPSATGALLRGAFRPIAARPRLRPHALPVGGEGGRVVVLVTQSVHARLFEPVGAALEAMGLRRPIRIAARTGEQTHVDLAPVTDLDLRSFLFVSTLPALVGVAAATAIELRRPPDPWSDLVDVGVGRRLTALLRVAVPRLAIDAARLRALLATARPPVVACFSESGLLARLAPAAAAALELPVLDLPHAEAADPWGTAGVGYDGVAVFGPRAASVMRLAGVSAGRIVEIGPLGHDDLHGVGGRDPDRPHRVLFASQPVDEARAHLAGAVKRTALESALAVSERARPAELTVLAHPTEDPTALSQIVGELAVPAGVDVEVEPPGALHTRLPGAFVLVTASSQSAFDAVLAGVPAIVVQPPGVPVAVTFVEDGIAIGVSTTQEARRAAASLLDPVARQAQLDRARDALSGRIGPLDGRAAERAARWLAAAGR